MALNSVISELFHLKDDLIGFSQLLVQTPSLSGQEEAVARLLGEKMSELNFDETWIDELGNSIGLVKGEDSSRKILYNGHMDTVDVGLIKNWKFDPYGGIIDDGKLYGRGSTDMKTAIATQIFALGAILKANQKPKYDNYVVGITHEETREGETMRHVVEESKIVPDLVILGEATERTLKIGHRGRAELQIVTYGKTSHGSMPHLGHNAVYDMSKIVNGLETFNEQLNAHEFVGKGTVTLMDIYSEPGANVVPDLCVATLDRRIIPGETADDLLTELKGFVDSIVAIHPEIKAEVRLLEEDLVYWTGVKIHTSKYMPAWAMDPANPIIVNSVNAIESTTGDVPKLNKWIFSTDGIYTAGEKGIPTIGWGPGDERMAHQPDEYVPVDDLLYIAKGNVGLSLKPFF
ncbi:MAG: YgeY family selenium metabolism-linked hydrolase [Candidatus Kariarchaeaceae archaeon]